MDVNRASRLTTHPLDGPFGAEIRGVDLARPLDAETFDAIRHAFHEHGVLLFRDQDLTPAQQVAFSRPFGPLEEHVQAQFLLPGHPEIFVVGNQTRDGKPAAATNCALSWHSDHSYHALPSLGSLFYGVTVPPFGGDTWFAEMTRPYEELPAGTKEKIDGLRAVHDYRRLVEKQFPDRLSALGADVFTRVPPVAHPVARTHPVTRRKSLFLGGEVISHTEKNGEPGSRDIVAELLQWATQDRFVYKHRWRKGDLVFWDNRCTMHRAGSFDDGRHLRVMHRTTLIGGEPF